VQDAASNKGMRKSVADRLTSGQNEGGQVGANRFRSKKHKGLSDALKSPEEAC